MVVVGERACAFSMGGQLMGGMKREGTDVNAGGDKGANRIESGEISDPEEQARG